MDGCLGRLGGARGEEQYSPCCRYRPRRLVLAIGLPVGALTRSLVASPSNIGKFSRLAYGQIDNIDMRY